MSLNKERTRHSFDVLFVLVPYLDQEISPFFRYGHRPLVFILNYFLILVTLISANLGSSALGPPAVNGLGHSTFTNIPLMDI